MNDAENAAQRKRKEIQKKARFRFEDDFVSNHKSIQQNSGRPGTQNAFIEQQTQLIKESMESKKTPDGLTYHLWGDGYKKTISWDAYLLGSKDSEAVIAVEYYLDNRMIQENERKTSAKTSNNAGPTNNTTNNASVLTGGSYNNCSFTVAAPAAAAAAPSIESASSGYSKNLADSEKDVPELLQEPAAAWETIANLRTQLSNTKGLLASEQRRSAKLHRKLASEQRRSAKLRRSLSSEKHYSAELGRKLSSEKRYSTQLKDDNNDLQRDCEGLSRRLFGNRR